MAEWEGLSDFLGTDFSGTPSGGLEARMEERWGEIQDQLSSEQFGQMEHEMNVMGYGDQFTGDEIVRAGLGSDVHTDWTSPETKDVPSTLAGMQYDTTGLGDTVVEMNPAYFDYNQTLAGNTGLLGGLRAFMGEKNPYSVDPQYNPDTWRHEYAHAGLDKYRQIDPEGYPNLNNRIIDALNPNFFTSSILGLDEAYALPKTFDAEEMFNRYRDFLTSQGTSKQDAADRWLGQKKYSPDWGQLMAIYNDVNEALRANREYEDRGGN